MHVSSFFVPFKRKRVNSFNPWKTREIINLKRKLPGSGKHTEQLFIEIQVTKLLFCSVDLKIKCLGVHLASMINEPPSRFSRFISFKVSTAYSFVVNKACTCDTSEIAKAFNAHSQSVVTDDNNIRQEIGKHKEIPQLKTCKFPSL